MQLDNVQLEMSLKPFKDDSEATAYAVCRELFEQWAPLCRHADRVSVLLWTADGSEILEYKGELDEPFEWARYIGHANPRRTVPNDPNAIALHSKHYLYIDNPPVFTYGWLKRLNAIIKEVGRQVTGKPIRVGETFDPGPEFAQSPFKYERHTEICMGTTMGPSSFVACYATLKGDTQRYAGFPDGIPDGTPMGTFLGRQCQHLLTDLGFDYVWLSNGFGFGLEPWALRGSVFDGKAFSPDRCAEVRDKTLAFWDLFRAECPTFPIETRGTNLSTGADLASDALPLREIYRGGYGMEPPPNSPWAAINADFGVELVGWMSHIAETPGETYPFRFYTHDPWWLNSPWLDRYGREPHDIHMPLSVCRLDAAGAARTPTAFLFLTCDDSYGNMPRQVPEEVIPHLLDARRHAPDQAGPLLWVYPFDEYHDWTFGAENRIDEVFFGDWFMRGAVNNGLPLNTVISTANLACATAEAPGRFVESVLVSPVPDAGGPWAAALVAHVQAGGDLLLYGPTAHAGDDLLAMLNLARAEALSGDFELTLDAPHDALLDRPLPTRLTHHALLSAGGMAEVVADEADACTRVLAAAVQDDQTRAAAVCRQAPEWNGGRVAWVRGTVACDPEKTSGHLLAQLDPETHFPAEALVRYALASFGVELRSERRTPGQGTPMLCVSRHGNGFFFSGYSPNTTVRQHLRFPQGAPVLLGFETRIENGHSTYSMPRAWNRECRVFIDQAAGGEVSCVEQHPGMVGVKRRMFVKGLDGATVRFYHEPGTEGDVKLLREPKPPYLVGDFVEFDVRRDRLGAYIEAKDVTGELLISW